MTGRAVPPRLNRGKAPPERSLRRAGRRGRGGRRRPQSGCIRKDTSIDYSGTLHVPSIHKLRCVVIEVPRNRIDLKMKDQQSQRAEYIISENVRSVVAKTVRTRPTSDFSRNGAHGERFQSRRIPWSRRAAAKLDQRDRNSHRWDRFVRAVVPKNAYRDKKGICGLLEDKGESF